MELFTVIACGVFIGLFSGFLAGLLGVGGGLVIVPILIAILPQWGLPSALVTHTAIGTSLASIVGTGLISVYAHSTRGSVRWELLAWFTPGLLLGALAGAHTASFISGDRLQALFGALMVGLSLLMLKKNRIDSQSHAKNNQAPSWTCVPVGGAIAWASSLTGIGGASFTVPYLIHWRVPITQAIGTAAACGVPLAFAGTLGYVFAEPLWQGEALSNSADLSMVGMTGFVLWPAAGGIVASSLLSARYGAVWAHRINGDYLRKIFAGFLVVVGFKLLLSARL